MMPNLLDQCADFPLQALPIIASGLRAGDFRNKTFLNAAANVVCYAAGKAAAHGLVTTAMAGEAKLETFAACAGACELLADSAPLAMGSGTDVAANGEKFRKLLEIAKFLLPLLLAA